MQKYRALIVDDEENSRSNTRNMLQNYCPEIEVVGEAGSGPEGKVKIQELKPHVVFLDINMPKLGGFEAAVRIREATPKVGLVMVTAVPTLDNVQRALKTGVGGFVVKPFNAVKVVDAIDKCLKQR